MLRLEIKSISTPVGKHLVGCNFGEDYKMLLFAYNRNHNTV